MLLIHEQSSPHTLIYLVGKLHHIAVEFTFMIHKVLVEILVYMHGSRYVVIFVMICVRGVPPRTRMIFVMICVRRVPPRSRVILIDDGYKVEKRYMHVSCQIHKLLMPLHAT